MLSRNNNKLLIHKLEPKKQRFAIRKISVGVASVLIGFTFAGFSGVSADEATTTAKDHLKTEATAESSGVPTKEVELTTSDETQAKEAEQTSSAETPAKETETTPVADDKAQVAEDAKEQAPAQAVSAEETSEPTTNTEKQTIAPADENEASETQTFNVEKQAEPQANVDLTDSKVAYAAVPTQAQDQQEEGFSVTDPDYSKYKYGKTNLQELIEKFGIDYKNSEYVFQWIASTDGERGIIFTVDRGRDANGNVILTDKGNFNAYQYYNYGVPIRVGGYRWAPKYKVVIQPGTNELYLGNIINDESRNAIAIDHFYAKSGTRYTPVFVGGHSGIEENSGNGYGVLSIYTPQVVEQKAKIDNGKVYKTQTGLTGQHYTTGVPKSAKVEEGKFLYAENSQGTMSEFHTGVVLVNDYHNGVIVEYRELNNQGTMKVKIYENDEYIGETDMKVGDELKYGNVTIANPYVQQTTDITYEYRTLGSVELYDENGNYLGQSYRYVNDANDAAKASLPEVPEEFPQGDIEYTLVAKEDLPSDLSRSIKYIYRGIETKVTHDTYTLTTKFVDEDGNELKAAEPQTITWTTTTKRDIHTNEIISQTFVPSKTSYMAVNSPVIAGYYATTPGLGSQKAEQKNVTQKIVYRKLGNIIAKDSQGNVLTKVHYENDANDATKIKEIVAPTIKGYHVKGGVVQSSDPGQDTVLNYGKDIQVAQIKYWDETAQKYITDDQGNALETIETGAYNTKISHEKVAEQIHALKAKGYEYDFANQEFLTVDFDDDDSKPQTFTVNLMHGTTTELESKQITREIHIHHPNQEKEVKKQTATLTRNVTRDKVTGDVTKTSDWNHDNFDEVEVPPHKGYKIDETPAEIQNGKVVGKLVTSDEEDGKKIDVKYIPLEQHALVKYVDDNTGVLLDEENIQGVTDAAIEHSNTEKITAYQNNGYELVSDELADEKDPHFNAEDEPQVFEVHLTHRVEKVTNAADLEKTVTRTIIAEVPNGKQEETQTVKFTRTGAKDLVTGKTTWSDWSPAQEFDAYTAPVVPGYTPSKATVERATVTADDKDTTIMITYTANDQKVMVKYVDVDENNKEVASQSVSGKTDQTVDVNYEVPTNYELVAGQDLPKTVTFKADGNEPIIVKVQHKHQDVTDEYKNDAHKQDKVDQTVKRIITIEHPHATDETYTQSLHFTRQVTRDMATGHDTFGEWIPENADFFEEFAVPTLASDKGYTPEKTRVDRLEHITGDTDNQHVTVKFTANDQKAHVHYIDDTTGKKLEVVHVTGKTDEPIKHDSKAKVQDYLNKGYELVSDDFAKAGKPSYNAEDEDQHFEVHLKHAIKDVTDQHAEHEVKHTVNRHIIIKHPHAADETHTQSIHFTRQVTRDMTTGQDTFGEWIPESADFFEEFAVPTLASDKGYTPKKTKVDRLEHITGDTGDKREIVEFTANDQKAHVHYIDDTTGEKLADVHVTGKTDEPIKHDSKAKVQDYLDKGYELVSDDFAKAGKPSYNAEDEEQNFEVHLKHGQKDVTDEYKQDDNRKDHVDRTIKREIIINHPKEDPESYVQTAHFTRNVTRDTVTGEDKPGEWIPEENDFFEEVPVSLKDSDKGYTPEKTKVDRLENISADTPNQKEVVEFTPNEQHALVKYVDDSTGTLLDEEDIQGVTDAAIEHTNDEKIAAYQAKGYELVSDELADENDPHFNAEDEAQVYTVHLKHGSKVVKADPSNADSQKEVKRTIIVNAPDGTKTTKVQTVVFTRDGSKDLVTGKISYPDWDEIATKAFSQDDVPQYLGYTSMVAGRKQTIIAAQNVRPTDADQVIEVSYVARPSQQVITYQDENGNQIGTQVITGHTDETVKLVPVLPDGWELLDPDSLPENVTFAPEENPVLVITVKRTVTEDSAKTEKTGENTEVAKQEVVNDTTDVTTDEKNEATLPQMGESDSETLAFSLLGLVTAAFSLFYFGKERRKTDN